MLKIKITIILFALFGFILVILPSFGISTGITNTKVSLGFDLKGGSSLLLKVDLDYVVREKTVELLDEIKSMLINNGLEFSRIITLDDKVVVYSDGYGKDRICASIKNDLSNNVVCSDVNDFLQVSYTHNYLNEIKRAVMNDTIQNLRMRVDGIGTKEAIIYSRGSDGITLDMPGIHDPKILKNIIGKTAKLTFHKMADKTTLDKKIVSDKRGKKFYLNSKSELSGNMFKSVKLHMGKMGKPSIAVQFNSLGTKKFSELTKHNVHKQLAIVIDDIMLTNPVINEHIANGQAEISGSFSKDEAKELVVLLKSGSLPAPLKIEEERIVGPSLGLESINQSIKAGFYASILVAFFMLVIYGTFGLFAIISLMFCMLMILSIITILNVTLTLPGIAGLILTVGMSVDTNILIFERIRDESKNKQNIHNVIEKGFKYAKSTIMDSNLTTLIASGIMFIFGGSSIKGFAVTVSIGIFCSLISGIFVTHSIISAWIIIKKPKSMAIGLLNR